MKLQATKKPTGLDITRKGNKFALSWKIGDSDYKDGQWIEKYLYDGKIVDKMTFDAIGVKDNKDYITLTLSEWYPYTTHKITQVKFSVKGDRKKFSYQEYDKKKKQQVTKTYDPKPSGWASKTFDIYAPNAPVVTRAWDASAERTTVFTATVTETEHNPVTRLKWESILVKNSSAVKKEDIAKLKWSSINSGWQTGTQSGTTKAVTIAESVTPTNTVSYTRYIRFMAQGIGGHSDWVYSYHVYGVPNVPTVVNPKIEQLDGNIVLDVAFNTPSSATHPIDASGITLEYTVDTPATGLERKVTSTWEKSPTRDNTSIKNSDIYHYDLGTALDENQCVWYRLSVKHDATERWSDTYLRYVGYLSDPTLTSVTPNWQTGKVSIVAENNAIDDVTDSWLAAVCSYNGLDVVIGAIEGSGSQTEILDIPADAVQGSTAFGVYAVVGTLSGTSVLPYDGKIIMRSKNTIWQTGDLPVAPGEFSVSKAKVEETALLEWEWTWSEADSAQITWSDNPLAWESNDEPQEYMVSSLNPSHWYISGLEEGKTWYFRIRLAKTDGDNTTYGAWSSIEQLDLRSAPNKPTLELSEYVITDDGITQGYWAYVTTDGTPQSRAEICEAIYVSAVGSPTGNPSTSGYLEVDANGLYFYSTDTTVQGGKTYYIVDAAGTLVHMVPFASTQTEQHVDIEPSKLGWGEDETHQLCVRVTSESGINSEEWSDPVSLRIAAKMYAAITDIDSSTWEVVDLSVESGGVLSGYENRLTGLPLVLTVSGAGAGVTTVAIERAEDYEMERPDEDNQTGYAGETVALVSDAYGNSDISIGLEDITGGYLDDGARYKIVVTTRDDYGQVSAPAEVEFRVKWAHQAVIPDGTVTIEDNYAIIVPTLPDDLPTGWSVASGDGIDIYRLSADKPELIYPGAEFGVAYVDPYPAIGGGYRLVYKTVYGDYIVDATADNGERIAYVDVDSNFDYDRMIINFGGDTAELYYNIDEEDTWSKDFLVTKYLGGSIVGDWNPGVEHNAELSGVVITVVNEDTVNDLRRLAEYAGAVHVRTKSGSSYTANVNVKRTKSHEHFDTRYSYGLSITKVDAQGFDGVKYTDYLTSLGYLLDGDGNRIVDEDGAYIVVDNI